MNSNDKQIEECEHEDIVQVIWIEKYILSDEYTKNFNEMYKDIKENCYEYKEFRFNALRDLDVAIRYIKNIRFEATFIIISDTLYYDFFVEFYNNMNNIYIIPQIIIFSKRNDFIKEDLRLNKIPQNKFYKGKTFSSFEEIKKYIIEEIKQKEVPNHKILNFEEKFYDDGLIFDYIDKKEKFLLPIYYKALIESNPTYSDSEFIANLYRNIKDIPDNEEKQREIDALKNLVKSIFTIEEIPIQLLSKYYIRIYTYESNFYYDLNTNLRNTTEMEMSKYLPFIKTLYKGVDLKSLPLYTQKGKLYRCSKASIVDINNVEIHMKEHVDFPTYIVFSRVFLSFSKNENQAKVFLKGPIDNKKLYKVFFVVEKDDNIESSFSSHADIENLSSHEDENEVLFFPFSAFEIINIEDEIIDGENVKKIALNYIGKYLKEFKIDEKNIDIVPEIILPDSKFKENLIKSCLVKEKEVSNITNKEIIRKYDKYKTEIKKSQNKIKNERKAVENEENFEIVSVTALNKDLTIDLVERQRKSKIKCTKCKLFSFILFLSLLLRVLIYFIVYIAIRNENKDVSYLETSALIKALYKPIIKRSLSKYNFFNCNKGQSIIINSNMINIGFGWDNNNISNINDLYLSIDGLDKNNYLIDTNYSWKLKGLNKSVTFSNYKFREEDYKDKETFKINLDKIPDNIYALAIILTCANKNSILKIKTEYIRIYEEDTKNEISHYLLNNIKDGVSFLCGIIERKRKNNKWIFRSIYESLEERNISYYKKFFNETILTNNLKQFY